MINRCMISVLTGPRSCGFLFHDPLGSVARPLDIGSSAILDYIAAGATCFQHGAISGERESGGGRVCGRRLQLDHIHGLTIRLVAFIRS